VLDFSRSTRKTSDTLFVDDPRTGFVATQDTVPEIGASHVIRLNLSATFATVETALWGLFTTGVAHYASYLETTTRTLHRHLPIF
jgi:hypothetical protein